MPIIESARRLSEYLDRQAVLQKEKRKEKFLTILPTYLERTISGISDEESLYATIPKLSAEMYRYGADIGQQATSILGNLASGKLRELQEKRQKADTESQIGLYQEAFKNVPLDMNTGIGNISDLISSYKGKVSDEILAKNIPTLVQARGMKQVGQVSNTDKGLMYNQWWTNPATGETKYGVQYRVDAEKGFMDDLTNTPDVVEELPLAPEVIDYMTKEKEDREKFERRLKASEVSQMRTFANQLDMQDKREQARIERELFIGDDGVPVYPRYEDTTEGKVLRFKVMNDKKYKDLINVGLSDPGNKEARESILKQPDLIDYTGSTPQSAANYVKSHQITPSMLDQVHQGARRSLMQDVLPKMRAIYGDDFDEKVKVTDPNTFQSYYDTEKIKELISDEMKESGGFLGFGGKSLESVIPGISKKVAEGDYTDEWVDAMVSKGAFDQESGIMFKGWRDYLNRMNMYYKGEKVYSEGLEKKLGTSQENNKPGWWNK